MDAGSFLIGILFGVVFLFSLTVVLCWSDWQQNKYRRTDDSFWTYYKRWL